MNCSPSNSTNLSQCKVTSKYFSGLSGMDESLSDFQEKKKACTGPKKAEKVSKTKSKKAPKRIRGQKDIRAVLKSKKNELVAYSNDFDKVCKQSGIDVDSEQLQLAIALSKSLQNTDDNSSQSSGSLNSQERTRNIRSTLLEYGFKVPEAKITASKRRRLNNNRKDFKLLLTSEAEKQQIICDKYAQVLLKNLHNSKIVKENTCQSDVTVQLYRLATQASYECIQNDNVFYVDNLFEKSANTVGSLLRDWSKIPGRPSTPSVDKPSDVKFTEIKCSEEELLIILSGSVIDTQNIVKSKQYCVIKKTEVIKNIEIDSELDKKMNTPLAGTQCHIYQKADFNIDTTTNCNQIDPKSNSIEIIDVEDPGLLRVPYQVRSNSPDMFDDEVSSIMESSRNTNIISQEISSKKTDNPVNSVMDLTECVIFSPRSLQVDTSASEKPLSQLSQGSNITKRKSNDFMEITNCVAGSSQPLLVNTIDLTQKSHNEDKTVAQNSQPVEANIESMDLTQSSNSDEELPFVQISGNVNKSLDDTIILNHEEYEDIDSKFKKSLFTETNYTDNTDVMDIKKTINLNYVKETPVKVDAVIDRNSNPTVVVDETVSDYEESDAVLDLTQDKSISPDQSDVNARKSNTESFSEEFEHLHSSDDSKEPNTSGLDQSSHKFTAKEDESSHKTNFNSENNDIDLTQNTDSSEETNNIDTDKSKTPQISYESLGKRDNVSIDYDEIFDEVVESYTSNSKHSCSSTKSITRDATDNVIEAQNITNDLVSNSSQASEAFEISDNELNYSLQKSRRDIPIENFNVGGISIMDNLSNIRSSKSILYDENQCYENDSLPIVNIKNNYESNQTKTTSNGSTPFKYYTKVDNMSIETPTNSEYIIKTDQVTPILDYASMTTPERNKELNKYGLKPFKRKRAIQLLTHLYNQTHPIIESCSKDDIDLPSPSKKLKTSNHYSPGISPRKRPKSQKVPGELPQEVSGKENDVYEVTNETPDIKDIVCDEEDWVFQKREKAKVHSCRVPLHIALHNYVNSRRALREAILRYEPVNIDVIHKGLVADGHRYDPKDLLRFMDKKCITVKTADNNSRNNKKHY